MNLASVFSKVWLWVSLISGIAFGFGNTVVAAADAKFEVQLVWATNDEKPPNDEYHPADAATRTRLESLGLKWKNFFVVKKSEFETKGGESGRITVSEKSSISVKLLTAKKAEITFYGQQGEECSRRVQPFKAGEVLVHGGNVPENATAWLITLKRLN